MIEKTTHIHGTDGLFTFNFFCESLIGALHSLVHVMEDNDLTMPDTAGQIPEALAQLGTNLLSDYGHESLDLRRIQQEILDFYDLAFTVNDALAPLVLKGNDTLQYYYYVYMQGINLFYPNFLQSLVHDIPDEENPQAFAASLNQGFASLSHS